MINNYKVISRNLYLHLSLKNFMVREFKVKLSAYQLIRESRTYISRKKILHKVNYVQKINNHIIIITNCGRKMVIRDSKRSRITRWLQKKHLERYLLKCKKCKF
jgi:hypothetical protein